MGILLSKKCGGTTKLLAVSKQATLVSKQIDRPQFFSTRQSRPPIESSKKQSRPPIEPPKKGKTELERHAERAPKQIPGPSCSFFVKAFGFIIIRSRNKNCIEISNYMNTYVGFKTNKIK